MKKTLSIIIVAIILSTSVFSQTKKDSVPRPLKQPVETEKILSRLDLEKFVVYMRDNFSVTYYESVKPTEVIQRLYDWFIKEYNKPKK